MELTTDVRMLRGLAAETEHRQSSATARGVNPDLDALLPKPEPFADVLRRISTTLHSPKSDVLELAKLANAKQAASQLQPEMQIQWDQLGASLPSDSNAMSGGWSTYDTAYDFTSDIWSALGLTVSQTLNVMRRIWLTWHARLGSYDKRYRCFFHSL